MPPRGPLRAGGVYGPSTARLAPEAFRDPSRVPPRRPCRGARGPPITASEAAPGTRGLPNAAPSSVRRRTGVSGGGSDLMAAKLL